MQETKTCDHYLIRKKRLCKFSVVPGSRFCAAHCSDLTDKIECPYQKGMFISAAKFEKHLQNCPKVRNRMKQQKSQWYSKDINKIQDGEHMEQNVCLSDVFQEDLSYIVRTIVNMYKKRIEEEYQIAYISSYQMESIQNTTNDHEQARLITQEAFKNKLISPQFIYIQFGAGKGILSYAVAVKIQTQFKSHSKNVLLERQSRRKKFDRFFKDNPYFQRYKGDVSNFDFKILPKIMAKKAIEKGNLQTQEEEIEKKLCQLELIGICKHMCGEALDISVRGLLQGNSKGCILASCCHHRCNYSTYLNPKFFEEEGLKPDQIQILFRISSWGTKANKFQKVQPSIFDHILTKSARDLNLQQKILVGRMCKRLIDVGRALFLGGKIYRYCSDQLTPENFVIISRN